jgi:hypothetical protein
MDRQVEANHPLVQPMTEPMFEVHSREGHVWKIYESGRIDGFPRDVWIINRLFPLLSALRSGIMYPHTIAVSDQHPEPVP